jgi:chromosome segregation ATPase
MVMSEYTSYNGVEIVLPQSISPQGKKYYISMNIGIEFIISLMATAVSVGVAYATLKVKIDRVEKDADGYASKEVLLQLHKESTDEQKQIRDSVQKHRAEVVEQYRELSASRQDHGTRLARLQEAMQSIKDSIASGEKHQAEAVAQYRELSASRQDHGMRLARLEEAMQSIKDSLASVEKHYAKAVEQYRELSASWQDHGTRLARLEEAMQSIKASMASVEGKLDRLLLK